MWLNPNNKTNDIDNIHDLAGEERIKRLIAAGTIPDLGKTHGDSKGKTQTDCPKELGTD